MKASRNEIRTVLVAADRCINDRKCNASDVMRILEPYLECTEITGVSEWASAGGIGLVHALAGDAYRREKNYEVAAQWYRRASERGVAHAQFYARVVCEARLTEHYEEALATIEREKASQRRRSWIARFLASPMRFQVMLDRDWWHYKLRERGDYEFLKAAVAKKG